MSSEISSVMLSSFRRPFQFSTSVDAVTEEIFTSFCQTYLFLYQTEIFLFHFWSIRNGIPIIVTIIKSTIKVVKWLLKLQNRIHVFPAKTTCSDCQSVILSLRILCSVVLSDRSYILSDSSIICLTELPFLSDRTIVLPSGIVSYHSNGKKCYFVWHTFVWHTNSIPSDQIFHAEPWILFFNKRSIKIYLPLLWDQSFCISHNDKSVDLSSSCSRVGLPMLDAHD